MKVKNIPCKLFTEDSQDGLVKCKVVIMNEGKNRNGSSFSKESMKNAEQTLMNRPLLSYIKRDDDGEAVDFGGHEIITKIIKTSEGYDLKYFYLETPIGIFPESCNIRYEEINGENHMVADAFIWEGYSNEALGLLNDNEGTKDVSMEITVLEATQDDDGILNIDKFRFNAVTLLGDDIIQGMNGNCNINIYSKTNYEEFVNEINKKIYSLEKEEDTLENNNENVIDEPIQEFGLSIQNITDQIHSQLSQRVVKRKDYWGEEYQGREFYFVDILPDSKVAIVEDTDYSTRQYFGITYSLNEDVVTLDFDNKKNYIQEWREMSGDVEPKVYSIEDNEFKEHIINKFNSIDKHEKELEELETLKTTYSELVAKVEEMKDYEELKQFKQSYDKAQYESEIKEITSKFELDVEDYEELEVKALNGEIAKEQYEKELYCILGMKQMNNKSNFSKVDKSTHEVKIKIENKNSSIYGELGKKYSK